ncbi:MAG: response regulator transcription factor [Clostridia bacterium]|nr:response regulator transcription factor [Clostridia bacterium]
MIFFVEDDSSIRDLVIYALTSAGFQAKGFPDSETFWDAMEEEKPELVMLDIMLPGEDGISVLKKLKSRPGTKDIPVIMATAKGSEYDRVIGLDTGADDYLCKPFGMMEMVSRIRAVLRRYDREGRKKIITRGAIVLDDSKHNVSSNGRDVTLTLKEYELLKIFMENPGIVLTRDRLLETVWDTGFAGESRTVDVHIGTLRTKLGEAGEQIKTVRGVGYRME